MGPSFICGPYTIASISDPKPKSHEINPTPPPPIITLNSQ